MLEYLLAFEIVALVTSGFFGYLHFLRKKDTKQEG